MSEYKRWISYIYNYDRGVKSTNAGYVRIESRVGKCRMTVNIKGGIAMGETLKMFVFYRDGADIILVEAGQAGFYNGICDFCASTVVDNVFGSGMNIEQMSGVIAYSTLDRFYGSQWDDKPIVLRRLVMHEPYRDAGHSAGVLEINGEPVDMDDVREYLKEDGDAQAEQEVEAADVGVKNHNDADTMGMVVSEVNEEVNSDASAEISVSAGNGGAVGAGKEVNLSDDVVSENGFANVNNAVGNRVKCDGIESKETVGEENQNDDIETDATQTGDTLVTDEPMSDALSRIFSRMPGMYPFEDDDIIECVKFDPQDIGMFPMEKWQLASNSFLLHGYYTYRHLIFARRRTVAGIKCMLGVPGMFRDREKFMAGMFGFGNFKGIRGRQNPGYGEFGYWYMDIDMK